MFYCKSSPVPRAKQPGSGGVRTVHQIVKYLIRYFPDPVQSRYLPSASGDKVYNYQLHVSSCGQCIYCIFPSSAQGGAGPG